MNSKSTTIKRGWAYMLACMLVYPFLTGCGSRPTEEENVIKIRDIDGNLYGTVQIGEQLWMAEDLKTTRYRDGTSISKVENYDEWSSIALPAYCWYNNDSANAKDFGALYNWYVLESELLCPEGWHVPTDEDWIQMDSVFGGAGITGNALKEAGTTSWKPPNEGATNKSGFAAKAGGYRSYNGTFNLIRIQGYWWSSTEASWYGSKSTVVYRSLSYDRQDFGRNVASKTNGFSVRCVKNP